MPEIQSRFTFKEHLPDADIAAAAELYETAFGSKFFQSVPSRSDRLELIQKGFNSDFAFTAYDGEKLVGLTGYKTTKGNLTDGITFDKVIKKLGWLQGLWASLIFSLYDRKPVPGQLVMDGISVHADYRGQGIGTQLLQYIVDYAKEQGYQRVRLDVIDINPAAKKLYTRFGFKAVKEEKFPFLKPLLGFGGATTMEYTCSHD